VWLIANVAASLPLHGYLAGTRERAPRDPLADMLEDEESELTPFEVWRIGYAHRVLWGNTYYQKIRYPVRSQGVRALHPLLPERMRVARYRPEDGIYGNKLFQYTDEWGTEHILTSYDVLHIPGFGYDGVVGCSPIRAAAQGVSLSLAAERSGAKFFHNGAMLAGVLQVEQRLNDEQAAALKARWKALHSGSDRAGEIAVLDSGAKFNPITMPYKDAQFLESRRFQVYEIARFLGVPPFLMFETEKSTSWGTGLEQQALGWVQFDLGPAWLVPTEQRVTKEIMPKGQYAKYALQGLLRGDSQARASFYNAMRMVGAFSANDIRALEDLGPIPNGDSYLQPLNMAPLGTTPQPDQPARQPDDQDDDEDGNDD